MKRCVDGWRIWRKKVVNPMRCPIETQESAELLLDYCARKLPAEQTALLERHMASCAACREFRDGQALVWEALDSWQATPVSPDFDRRLYARIAEEDKSSWWRRAASTLAPFFARPLIPVTAAACLVVVGGLMLRSPEMAPVAGNEAALTQEVEQVERTLEDLEMLRTLDLVAARAEDSSRTL